MNSDSNNTDTDSDDANPLTLGCDCDEHCREPPFEHRQFHDCSIIDKLFKSLDLDILQKLFNRIQYVSSACTKKEDNGTDFSIIIKIKKKTVKPTSDNKNALKSRTTKVGSWPKQKSTVIYRDENHEESDNDSDSDKSEQYIDADTLMIVPKPKFEDRKPFKPIESDEDEKSVKNRTKRIQRSIQRNDTLCHKKYFGIARSKVDKFHCPYDGCTKNFTRFADLKDHEDRIHLDNQKKPCTWPGCNKVFSCERAMRRHIYNVHQEVRRHKCPHCDKAFKTKYNLDDHIRTHTGEKPFECEYCGSRFAQNGSLVGHRKRCQKKLFQDNNVNKEQPVTVSYIH